MADHDADTRKDDLRTGTPFWVKTPHSTVKAARRMSRDRFDAIVVGAGISGALVAEALTRAGKSVLILDRRPPVRGSTPASTAMIQHEIDVPLSRLRRKIGPDHADRAWLRSARAVGDLVALSKKLGLDCHMRPKPALYLAGNQMGARALASEARMRAKIGIEAEYLKRPELLDRFGMDRPAAILSQASASANPAQLTAGLLRAALARKARIVSPVEITDMAELPGGVALATLRGEVLVADHAVFCTGYEYLPQMKTKSHHVTSTWALASRPLTGLPGWMRDSIVWEAADPYLYFRTDETGRIIAGGEDEEASETNADPAKLAAKAKVIARKLRDLTGLSIGRPAYAWSAPFSVTDDGLPIIDRVPGYERCFAVMGFGGNGITFSMIAAQIVAAEIAGKSDPDADIFRYR
ncbi:NAD(P)/FAD-dependent oxidoreductase [Paracoccus siganidrum]|uniref:FAD-binding oxidoreductase n=2 Tax=Paracoccus siganidrum TaxID=1276757 RepID=A0A419A930_9RHOB|nr:FAD-binding oxidoreductase [Paracoccus siganidrum]RJL18897.1 FAD-binding oxidoreductase [Paracoccus siganidrum]RMC30526.1 FAD-dependent oxidoreductase [Paracoccus siganidrum]